MIGIRDIRRKARRDLHNALGIPALYVPKVGEPVLLHVRHHSKFRVNAIEGAVRSGNGSMADFQDVAPSIIFMRDEIEASGATLVRGGIISIERNEAYRLDNDEPPDDITVRWFVTAIRRIDELAALPVPEVL